MRADGFVRLAAQALPELVRRYHLTDWWIDVEVADPEEMSRSDHVAEVRLEEPYRRALILVNRKAIAGLSREKALAVLEHEVQHITGWWLVELEELVMAALEEADVGAQAVVRRAFARAHELYRSTLGRLLKAGNNWEVP